MASNTTSTVSQATSPSTMTSVGVVAPPPAASLAKSAAVTLQPQQTAVNPVAAEVTASQIQVPSTAGAAPAPKSASRLRQARPNIPQEGKDVISERGEYAKRFNAHYRELVRQFYPAYRVSSGNETKRMLANEIISIIKLQGGRFFGGKSGREIMTHEQALVKVMKALKDHRRNDVVQQQRPKEAPTEFKDTKYWHMIERPGSQSTTSTEQQRALELQAKARATAGMPPLPQTTGNNASTTGSTAGVAPPIPTVGGGTAVIHTLNGGNVHKSPPPVPEATPAAPGAAPEPTITETRPSVSATPPATTVPGPSTSTAPRPVLPPPPAENGTAMSSPVSAKPAVIPPQPNSSPKPGVDVVCGRGEQAKRFNGHYRDLIRQFTPAYTSSSSMPLKRLLANEILNHIKSRGGRFFDGQGKLLTHHQSLVKTMKALKDAKRIHNVINHATLYSGMTGAPTTVALGAMNSQPSTTPAFPRQGGMEYARPGVGLAATSAANTTSGATSSASTFAPAQQTPAPSSVVTITNSGNNQAATRTVTDDAKQEDDDDDRVKNLSRDELEALGVLSQLGRAG